MAGRPWTEEEKQFIRKNFPEMSYEDMAEYLPGRAAGSIKNQAIKMGLRKKYPQMGDKVGMLWITSEPRSIEIYGVKRRVVDTRCECGTEKELQLTRIARGEIQSCGCLSREKASDRMAMLNETGLINRNTTTHGYSRHHLYRIYRGILNRCYYDDEPSYKNYGERGIRVCDEWLVDPAAFIEWALANGWKKGKSIERIDVNGNYEPANCTFATAKEQANNRRTNRRETAFGETKNLKQWSEDPRCKTSYRTLYTRVVKYGWSLEEAVITPTRNLTKKAGLAGL